MSSTTASNLAVLGLVDEVALVEADHGPVGGDRARPGGRRCRRTRRPRSAAVPVMPGELLVHAEVVLEGDRGEGLVLLLDLHPLLGLDGLVEALGPAAAFQDAAGELVDDLHLAVLDDVVLVALEQLLGLEGRLELVDEVLDDLVVEVLDARGRARPSRRRLLGGRRSCASPRRPRSRRRAAGPRTMEANWW